MDWLKHLNVRRLNPGLDPDLARESGRLLPRTKNIPFRSSPLWHFEPRKRLVGGKMLAGLVKYSRVSLVRISVTEPVLVDVEIATATWAEIYCYRIYWDEFLHFAGLCELRFDEDVTAAGAWLRQGF